MKTSIEYLDEAKEKLGISSDNEFAKQIGTTRAAISRWRHKVTVMDDYACTRVAEILGINPMEVITAANLEREKKNEERRRYWENFSKRMGWAAAVFLAVTSMGYGGFGQANVTNENMHYANNQRGRIKICPAIHHGPWPEGFLGSGHHRPHNRSEQRCHGDRES